MQKLLKKFLSESVEVGNRTYLERRLSRLTKLHLRADMAGQPFDAPVQLDEGLVRGGLPGFPDMRLQSVQALLDFLEREVLVTELDNLTRHLPAPSERQYHRLAAPLPPLQSA